MPPQKERRCMRCGEVIERPIVSNAHYVLAAGGEFTVKKSVEVIEAVEHNQQTRDAVANLKNRHYPNRTEEQISRAILSDTPMMDYLGTPPEDSAADPQTRRENARAEAPAAADFDRTEIPDVGKAPEGTLKVESRIAERDHERAGLVHKDHTEDTDEIIW